jgi:hypothetical protein
MRTITIGLFIALSLEAAVHSARESGAVAYINSSWISTYSWVYTRN